MDLMGTYGRQSASRSTSGKGSAAVMDISVGHGRHRATIAKMIIAAALTATTMLVVQNWSSIFNSTPRTFRIAERNVSHILVTGGAGYIGSHATLRLLSDGHRVTIVDNLSRGNMGAVRVLQSLAPKNRLQFVYADLGDRKAIDNLFRNNAIDTVIHFAAVAYVGESMAEPLRYYHNITANTLHLLQAMTRHRVQRLIYSSTCATYGEPKKMPIVESTPQFPINPYGKSKKMAEDIILDFTRSNKELAVTILRYFNVIGSDARGRLGEVPRAELRGYGRISGACFDAAMNLIPGLKILGTDYNTPDGTCVRDFIEVTDLVDAHVAAMEKLKAGPPKIYNVGTGKGSSVKEFVSACLNVTGKPIKIVEVKERRPGDYAEVYSDPSKIKNELGWVAKHTDLRETLGIAWKWREQHPNGYE